MPQPIHIIVGLGNPGPEYAMTRHNIGFMALDVLAPKDEWQKKFKGGIQFAKIEDHECLLLKPYTFMNLSGQSVGEAMRFYKLSPENVIVIHDDIDLLPGKVKVKQGGGAGGHNGLKSLDEHIGPNYRRIRLGVGRPSAGEDAADYVLRNFAKADQNWLEQLLSLITQHFPLLIENKNDDFMTAIARQMKDFPPPLAGEEPII